MKSGRNWWPIGIVVAFVVFVSGTIGLIVLACSQRVDLVSSDYYEQELRYTGQMERVERALQLGKHVSVTYDSDLSKIRVAIPADQARAEFKGRIHLYRPSAAGLDREIVFQPDASGVQWIDTVDLNPGLWKVRVSWSVASKDYYFDQPLVVSGKPS